MRGNAHEKQAGSTYLSTPTPKELNACHQLQKAFGSPSVLHHFDEKRQLYVDLDASKKSGFGAHVYHSTAESAESPKQKSQQPILFLSSLLTDAETRYWPTELEVAGPVWVVKKIRHMMTTIMYTDHSAAVSIIRHTSLNTTSTEKLNRRLVRASGYLPRFRLDVRYKPGKTNVVLDASPKLASREYRPEPEISEEVKCFPATLVTMNDDFHNVCYKDMRNQDGHAWFDWYATMRVRMVIGYRIEWSMICCALMMTRKDCASAFHLL